MIYKFVRSDFMNASLKESALKSLVYIDLKHPTGILLETPHHSFNDSMLSFCARMYQWLFH